MIKRIVVELDTEHVNSGDNKLGYIRTEITMDGKPLYSLQNQFQTEMFKSRFDLIWDVVGRKFKDALKGNEYG